MIFLHTSDWHLGATEGEYDLLEDQYYFVDEICRIISERKVDAVLLAGDVYDRSVASAAAIRLYDYAMNRICREFNTKVLTIAGNHDSAERLSSCGQLLAKAGLYISGAAEREPKVVSFDDAELFLLPWITEEKVRSLYPEERESIGSLTDAYLVVTGHMRDRFSPDKKHILVCHAFITNSETSTSDRAAEIGFATQVSADVFDGFDYVALGHIHKPQDVNDRIRYCGTPMPYSFGKEETQVKSVTLLDTETMAQEIIPLPLLHKRTTFTGTYEDLLNPSCPEEEKNGYVRLNVTDTAIGLELLSKLKQVYPHPLVVSGKVYEGDETTITLTMEELEQMENDPRQVFKSFCREEMGEEAKACPDHIHMLLSIPPKYSVSQIMGYLKGKSSLMIFDRHANLKYKYGNRHFWARGYYVDTVGRNKKQIKEYIQNQLREDQIADQMSIKEYVDPFTGSSNQKA